MTPKRLKLEAPPRWTDAQLERDRLHSIEVFRRARMQEPLEAYLDAFDRYQGVVEDLLESTVDLSELSESALVVLTDEKLLEAFRYLSGPPISFDDLKTLAESPISPARLKADPQLVQRIIDTVRSGLDQRRFPWVVDGREPSEAERNGAVLASAALMATQRLSTARRNEGKSEQEEQVRQTLRQFGFKEVERRTVLTLAGAPGPGEFCMESVLGKRKADVLVGLWDGRTMPLECKVSNSATNSIKRLNNDAAAKAEAWTSEFGKTQVIPTAVLNGVFKLHNLQNAQERGLTLLWSHRLRDLTDFIAKTRN